MQPTGPLEKLGQYRALVNTADHVQQAQAFGFTFVMLPNSLDRNRESVRILEFDVAAKAYRRKSRQLELVSAIDGYKIRKLMEGGKTTREAFVMVTRRQPKADLADVQRAAARRQLTNKINTDLGYTPPPNWTNEDIAAVLRDPTLLSNLKADGRPDLNVMDEGSIMDLIAGDLPVDSPLDYVESSTPQPAALDGRRRAPEEVMGNVEFSPEEMEAMEDPFTKSAELTRAAEAALEEDVDIGAQAAAHEQMEAKMEELREELRRAREMNAGTMPKRTDMLKELKRLRKINPNIPFKPSMKNPELFEVLQNEMRAQAQAIADPEPEGEPEEELVEMAED